MPYSKSHKQNTRERILNSAVTLFSRLGYDNVSIDDLMKDAQLTRGAFYAHFESKSDVYFHAIPTAASNAFALAGTKPDLKGKAWVKQFIQTYLSEDHIDHRSTPCPLAFMVTDVANGESKVRSAYTKVFAGFAEILDAQSKDEKKTSSEQMNKALAISAMMIGSVAIGRALSDNKLRAELLKSSSEIAAQILGVESS